MTPDLDPAFWDDPFHYAALVAGSIAQAEGRLEDSEYVRRLAYGLYEEELARKNFANSKNSC